MQHQFFITSFIQILIGTSFAKYDEDECRKFSCSFEEGDFCNYESKIYRNSDQSFVSTWKIFTSQSRAWKYSKSVSKNVNSYAAVVISQYQSAVLETKRNSHTRLSIPNRYVKVLQSDVRVIKFRYFITSPDVNIFACCNDVSNCPYAMPRMRQPVFYRWHRSSFECGEKLEKVLFYITSSKTSKSRKKSLVAIDDIQIFFSKSHPEQWKANLNVCETKYATTGTTWSKKPILPRRSTNNLKASSLTTTPVVNQDDDYEIVILPGEWENI